MNYETEKKEILKRHAAELAEFESNAALVLETKHTPGPWEKNKWGGGSFICAIDDGYTVACLIDGSMAEANAAFIVRACNCHDELVEALQHVLDNLTQESEEVWEHEIAHLQNALAKAEG